MYSRCDMPSRLSLMSVTLSFFFLSTASAQYQSSDPSPQAPSSQSSSQGYGSPFSVSESAAGAIAGAIVGAGSSAIIGSHKGKAGQGAAIGAGIGGLSGYAIGRQLQGRSSALAAQEQHIARQRQELARNRALLEELKRRGLDTRETPRGVVVNLPDILFGFNSARFTSAARSKVSAVAQALNGRARNRRVSIEGHTDAIGSDTYNLRLSKRRATTVTEELRYAGVGSQRLQTNGYGEKYPVAPNTHPDGADNPSGRAKNRRVEVVIEN
jgi:outer membrane protein OmpA-like peptidoglycan-associated protein